jgi:hypothetical protein
METDDKLRLKRERNKESARESRKRKKEKTEDVKKQITMIEAANLQLRLQLNVGYTHELNHDNNFIKSQIAGKLNKLLKEGAPEEEIHATIKLIQEKYSGDVFFTVMYSRRVVRWSDCRLWYRQKKCSGVSHRAAEKGVEADADNSDDAVVHQNNASVLRADSRWREGDGAHG